MGFSLKRGQQQQPLTLTSVDTLGLLRIEAELVLPGGNVPTTLPLTVGSAVVNSEPYEAKTPAGTYPITVPPVAGAQVSAPADITVKKGETALARVQVRPTVALTLRADKAEVCVGDVVTFTAEVRTAYAGELPLDLALSSDAFGSGSLKLEGDAARSGSFSAAQPGSLTVQATAGRAGDFSVRRQTVSLGRYAGAGGAGAAQRGQLPAQPRRGSECAARRGSHGVAEPSQHRRRGPAVPPPGHPRRGPERPEQH